MSREAYRWLGLAVHAFSLSTKENWLYRGGRQSSQCTNPLLTLVVLHRSEKRKTICFHVRITGQALGRKARVDSRTLVVTGSG